MPFLCSPTVVRGSSDRRCAPSNDTLLILGGTRTYSVAAGSLLRLGQIFEAVGAPLEDGLRVTVAIAAGTAVPAGGILAAAYTLDNRTQDAFAFVGQRASP